MLIIHYKLQRGSKGTVIQPHTSNWKIICFKFTTSTRLISILFNSFQSALLSHLLRSVMCYSRWYGSRNGLQVTNGAISSKAFKGIVYSCCIVASLTNILQLRDFTSCDDVLVAFTKRRLIWQLAVYLVVANVAMFITKWSVVWHSASLDNFLLREYHVNDDLALNFDRHHNHPATLRYMVT